MNGGGEDGVWNRRALRRRGGWPPSQSDAQRRRWGDGVGGGLGGGRGGGGSGGLSHGRASVRVAHAVLEMTLY